jgi:predicted RNase H-like nuclease
MVEQRLVVGVHGGATGWIAAVFERGRFTGARRFVSFEELLETLDEARVITVDVPVGLTSDSMRICDALLRELVGADATLEVPPRRALVEASRQAADTTARRLTGHGVCPRTWAMRDMILELDAAVQHDDERSLALEHAPLGDKPRRHLARVMAERKESKESLRRFARIIEPSGRTGKRSDPMPLPAGRIVQGNAEASFRQLRGSPVESARNTPAGVAERLELLANAGVFLPKDADRIGGLPASDVVDAAALAWTAGRYAMGRARSVPPPELWQRVGVRVITVFI